MKKTLQTWIRAVGLLSLCTNTAWSGCALPAGASGSNPNSRYVISLTNQEVYDTQTDITWQRCPYNWFVAPDGKSCLRMMGINDKWSQRMTSDPRKYPNNVSYSIAPMADHSNAAPPGWRENGWQLPSKNQLASLIDHICKNPAINQEVFPNTPVDTWFWTGELDKVNSHDHAFIYVISFAGDGGSNDHEDTNYFYLRLMKKGKSPAILVTLEKRPVAAQ